MGLPLTWLPPPPQGPLVSKWQQWHADYDDPGSSLSRRLEVVRGYLGQALADQTDPIRLISLCAGDGRDSIPVIGRSGRDVQALLVELDPQLAEGARTRARDHGVAVTIRTADAGLPDSFDDYTPATIFMLCGIFGNISDADIEQTITVLPSYLAPGAQVIWTRGDHETGDKTATIPPSERVRRVFADTGYEEVDFTRPDDTFFRVGVHRWPGATRPIQPAREPMFRFLW